jgi:two-component system sensor histidine kinase DctS
MKNDNNSDERHLDELMELHERITDLQKLESERKQAEDLLRESEEKIHRMFDDADAVITIVENRLIKYVNPQVKKLLGYAPDEIIGAAFAHYVHPDELPKLAKIYQQRLAGDDIPNVYETVLKHKNGADVPVEIKAAIVQFEGKIVDFAIVRKAPHPKNG